MQSEDREAEEGVMDKEGEEEMMKHALVEAGYSEEEILARGSQENR